MWISERARLGLLIFFAVLSQLAWQSALGVEAKAAANLAAAAHGGSPQDGLAGLAHALLAPFESLWRWAFAAPPETAGGFWTWAAFWGTLGATAGAFAKWVLEQWSAQRASNLRFAEEATRRVVDLSNTHYWAMANQAGSLSGSLREHLEQRAVFLMLHWYDREEMFRVLDENANETADRTFPMFCKLVSMFDKFHFTGSNNYLFKSHFAGELCRRLYNALIDALPQQSAVGRNTDTHLSLLRIAAVMRESQPNGETNAANADQPDARKVADLPAQEFMAQVASDKLSDDLEAWRRWLRTQTPDVARVADILRAFDEVIAHELAVLYKTYYKNFWLFDRIRSGVDWSLGRSKVDRYKGYFSSRAWPGVVGPTSFGMIEDVANDPVQLRTLGTAQFEPTPVVLKKAESKDKIEASSIETKERPKTKSAPGAGENGKKISAGEVLDGLKK